MLGGFLDLSDQCVYIDLSTGPTRGAVLGGHQMAADPAEHETTRAGAGSKHLNVLSAYSFSLPDMPGGFRELRDPDTLDEEDD
jgi:hypothetical protein